MKLVRSFNGMIAVAAVDCLEQAALCESEEVYVDQAIPVFKLYTGAVAPPRRYGGPPSAKALASFAFFSLPNLVLSVNSRTVEEKTDAAAPPLPPRVLLFTDKTETPNLYKALAQRLHGRLRFAELRTGKATGKDKEAERKLLADYGVDSTPAVVVEQNGRRTLYEGAMSFPALLSFLQGFAGEEAAAPAAGQLVDELKDASCINAYCLAGKASLCAVLIASGSSPSLQSSLSLFHALDVSRQDPVFHHVWLDSDKHADFLLSAFGLYPADYPQLVALSAKRERYVSYMGAFTPEDIADWLRKITAGKLRPVPYETRDGKLPALDDGDEEDACLPPPPPIPSGPHERYLHHLSFTSFPTTVLDSRAAWMLLIAKDAHLQAALPVWLQLVNRTRNAVRIGLISGEREPQLLRQLNVSASRLPLVLCAAAGTERKDWKEYTGELSEPALRERSLQLLHSRHVQQVRGEDGLAAFMRGETDTPRILLFSKHSAPPPLLQSLSIDFHPHLVFGIAQETDAVLTGKFSVKKIPSFVALAQLEKAESAGPAAGLDLVAGSYDASMQWEDLAHWLTDVRRVGVVNDKMPDDVKRRYRAGRKQAEESRLQKEEEEKQQRRKEEKQRLQEQEAAAKQSEDQAASCEVSADDSDGGMCTAPPKQ